MTSTLAPPAVNHGSSARKLTKLQRRPTPQPAGPRPSRGNPFPYKNLLRLPKRILMPPKATGMVGSVRSFKSTPLTDVKLADVIANKHLAPLSLKDFEGYLVYKEHSAESLYFILWLNEYTKEYQAWLNDSTIEHPEPKSNLSTDPMAPRRADHLPDYLADSLERAMQCFMMPNAPLELNLAHNTRDKTLVEAGQTGRPEDFSEARDVIEHSLNRSLQQHSKTCIANAGPRRLVFCFCLGLSVFLLGLVPPFVGIFGNYARGYRAIGLFFIWFGSAVMYMAVNRICGVIWLLGEDRQLLPWERETTAPVMSSSLISIETPISSTNSNWDEESTYGVEEAKSPESSFKTQTSSDPYPWEKQELNYNDQQQDQSTRPPSYYSKQSDTRSLVPESAPVWGACTAVFSPDVIRVQWRYAIHSFLFGLVILCTVGVALMAVPNA
ncbi:hypothetical protein OIO90_004119 [Microbotryomycetes sp. JL221]|nr:hypothetical protein OIO90_004119 [Microbotryomycetes sp. JL221]